MTNAEVKVKEVADVVREKINQWKKEGTPNEVILVCVEAYLAGLGDGIDFCDEMRRCEQKAADSIITKIDQHEAKMDARFAQPASP